MQPEAILSARQGVISELLLPDLVYFAEYHFLLLDLVLLPGEV